MTINSSLLGFLESDDPHNWKGIVLAAGIFVCNIAANTLIHNFLYYTYSAGIRTRSICNSIVYRKVSNNTMFEFCAYKYHSSSFSSVDWSILVLSDEMNLSKNLARSVVYN